MNQSTVVFKIGSSSLTHETGELSEEKVKQVVQNVSAYKRSGGNVVLVSSGAIASGYKQLNLTGRPQSVREKQAAAAVGQGILIQHYRQQFARYGLEVAQVLLNRSDFSDRQRYMNVLNTLNLLLSRNIVPVINENDSVATEEIHWGDNDFLAAQTAGLLQARWLVLATTKDGVYTQDPSVCQEATPIPYLPTVSKQFIRGMDDTHSPFGTGGMRSKLEAARYASQAGIRVYIGKMRGDDAWLSDVLNGKGTGTYIGAASVTPSRKEQWIGVHSKISGRLTIDDGAERALTQKNRSLLPCGVVGVDGHFQVGEVVEVINCRGETVGRGVVNFSSDLLNKAKGLHTRDIMARWNVQVEEVIHRDNWVRQEILEDKGRSE